jgi:hypothetical protein
VSDTDTAGGADCPMLDCRDALTLVVLDPDGTPADRSFGGWVEAGGVRTTFSCFGGEPFDGGFCNANMVTLYVYASTFDVYVDQGDDAPYWSGDVTPVWDAPYDSPECGHYCWLAEDTVQLDPCDPCG